jgi:biopolymer transport protein ExbB/TolQ
VLQFLLVRVFWIEGQRLLHVNPQLAKALYLFFFRSGQLPVQAATSYLFWAAIVFIIAHVANLLRDTKASTTAGFEKVEVFSRVRAAELAASDSAQIGRGAAARRLRALLQAFAIGEDPMALNEALSNSDQEQVERGHILLNTLKQLLPVLGFFGTVLGLSGAMISFPKVASQAQNVEQLRATLQGFASQLSVAFETTLLALGYAVIVVILTAVLKQEEEAFVARIDEIGRDAAARFRHDETHTRPELNAVPRGRPPSQGDLRTQLERENGVLRQQISELNRRLYGLRPGPESPQRHGR